MVYFKFTILHILIIAVILLIYTCSFETLGCQMYAHMLIINKRLNRHKTVP